MANIKKNFSSSPIPLLTLNDGYQIPQLGLGVYQLEGDVCYNAVRAAIQAGYRHVDTAAVYGNEQQVGKAIRDAISAGEVSREELFVTTKLWNDRHEEVEAAFHDSLEKLGLDYVDLYLIHWPIPKCGTFVSAYQEMLELRDAGKIASVGVCNFYPGVLDEAIEATGVVPALNQIEVHPGFSQAPQRANNQKRGMLTEAWSPLKAGQNLDDPALQEIADAHNVTIAQAIIRWHIQRGDVVIPRSSKPERIAANADVFGFELSDEEVQRITDMDQPDGRRGPAPLTFYAGTEFDEEN